jgi:hypothetical protein
MREQSASGMRTSTQAHADVVFFNGAMRLLRSAFAAFLGVNSLQSTVSRVLLHQIDELFPHDSSDLLCVLSLRAEPDRSQSLRNYLAASQQNALFAAAQNAAAQLESACESFVFDCLLFKVKEQLAQMPLLKVLRFGSNSTFAEFR